MINQYNLFTGQIDHKYIIKCTEEEEQKEVANAEEKAKENLHTLCQEVELDFSPSLETLWNNRPLNLAVRTALINLQSKNLNK